MSFVGKVWKLLVGIKDGLVLLFMLLFFLTLFSILSSSPSPAQVREGALFVDLNGVIVEEKTSIDPLSTLLAGQAPTNEFLARDLVRALDAAASDDRITAVVMDMSSFIGGGQVHVQAIAEAMDRVRKADKPVLTFAFAYGDDHMHLAAHATEVWADPMGGAMITGPGGTNLYYGELLDRLKVKVNVFRVGEFKSAVEPYILNKASAPARENRDALYLALWEEYKANVMAARPDMDLARVTSDPTAWIEASKGDLAQAALEAGLVDRLGDSVEFGTHVAEIVGEDKTSDELGSYANSDFQTYLADVGNGYDGSDNKIAVVTVAGTIVDGEAGPGTAGGTRIANLINDAASDDKVKGLVLRVNSPGGSATASEDIRRAIERVRAKDKPVAVSFANVAASGGYWVATAGDRIFAQPETITGSIGVFAVLPTFEDAADEIGLNADGFRATPLAGQPDVIAGLNPETKAMLQGSVNDVYNDFLERVGAARGMTTQEVDQIAQGRVWDGGTARQKGLVDQFGGLPEALSWVAGQAELEDGDWAPNFLGASTDELSAAIRDLLNTTAMPAPSTRSGDMFAMAAQHRAVMMRQLIGDAERLVGTQGVQAYCIECAMEEPAANLHQAEREGLSVLQWMTGISGR